MKAISFLYPEFKKKALTFSYDDGCRQDIRLTRLMKSYGVTGTFNLNSGSFGYVGRIKHYGFDCAFDKVKRDEIEELYKGFEIASHGVKHLNFDKLSFDELKAEVLCDAVDLRELSGQCVLGAAYPCGVYSFEIASNLKKLGIRYCRTISNTYSFSLPEDFLIWHPTAHDMSNEIEELTESFLSTATPPLALFYIWGHSFELDKNDCDRWAHFESILKKLSGNDDIFYATNLEICDYVTAVRKLLKSNDKIENPTDTKIFLSIDSINTILLPGESISLV